MWVTGLIGTTLAHIDYSVDLIPRNTLSVAYRALIISPPIIAVVMATYVRVQHQRPDFWRRVVQLSLSCIIGGTSIATIAGTSALVQYGSTNQSDVSVGLIQSLLLFVGAGVICAMQRSAATMIAAHLLAISGVILVGVAFIGQSDIAAAILFMLLWSGVAASALMAGVRWLFQVAIGFIALRLIVLSFELANDLLGSGIGLILVGIFTLGIAWGALTISRRFAPKIEVTL